MAAPGTFLTSAQHLRGWEERRQAIAQAADKAGRTRDLPARNGIECPTITGAGTGTFEFESASGVYTELQCGSYIFMDADYGRNLDHDGAPTKAFEPSLFVWATVMSRPAEDRAIVDAGLKALAFDSGPPLVCDEPAAAYERLRRARPPRRRGRHQPPRARRQDPPDPRPLRPDRQPLRPSGSSAGCQSAWCYAGGGSLQDARARSFQPPSCFCQICMTPILVLVTLPSSSLSETQRCRTTALFPTTCTVSSGHSSDLMVAFRHHPVDEFGLVLEPSVRMAVAQLLRSERLYLRFVLFEPGHPQLLNGISYRRFISRLGVCGSDQTRRAERERACGGEVTT
jgi:hypothetical protein